MKRSPMDWLRNRTLPLLLAMVALIALHPVFVEAGGTISNGFPVLVITVPLLGLLAIGTWRKAFPLVILFVVMFVWAWIGHDFDQVAVARSWLVGVAWVYYIYAIMALASELLKNSALIDDRVYGGLTIYLLTALMFASVHRHVSALDPNAYVAGSTGKSVVLVWDSSLYFSIATITTVGYGDIVPITPWARSAVMLEAICGVFITIVFIARLAALHTPGRARHESP